MLLQQAPLALAVALPVVVPALPHAQPQASVPCALGRLPDYGRLPGR